MLIDIFHDTACPWCHIGKQNLFAALAKWQGEAVDIQWHAFLLDDTIPPEGSEFRAFMQARKGIGTVELQQLFDYVKQRGEAAGVKLNFAQVSLAVNTKLSHQLIALTPPNQKVSVVEAIYQAYFAEGKNIGDIDTLVAIGNAAGMDVSELRQLLSQNAALEQVLADTALAKQQRIASVPHFIFNHTISVSGSQSVEVLLQALNSAALLTVS